MVFVVQSWQFWQPSSSYESRQAALSAAACPPSAAITRTAEINGVKLASRMQQVKVNAIMKPIEVTRGSSFRLVS